jgi:hypothetical protein
MVSRLSTFLVLALITVLPVMSSLAQTQTTPQALSSFVDRNEVTLNEIFTLTVRVDSTLGNTRPSLSALNRDFEQIGNVSTRSSYTNINGTVQSFVDYIIRLRARSTGNLTIPAFRIGGEVTTPIRITVGDAAQGDVGSDNEIFILSSVSKDRVYVQEQLLYTIKLYYSISFDQGAQLTSPQVADSVVQQLGSDETYSEIVDGIRYNVTERKFVIFPQSSGELTIPPVYFTATVGRRGGLTRFFNNRTSVREINLSSESHAIEVLGKPASFPGQTWLPASNLSIIESWSGALDNLSIGDSVTRNIRLSANGLSSSLLPGINYQDMPGLKFYPDQPVREDTADETGVTGIRSEGTAIVPSEAGEFVIPEVIIPWWNTTTDTLEEAVIPAQTLSVVSGRAQFSGNTPSPVDFSLNNPGATSGNPSGAATVQSSGLTLFWISSTAVFAIAWLFTTTLLLRSRRQLAFLATATPAMFSSKKATSGQTPSMNADAALKVLRTALTQGTPAEIRRCLIAWGQALFQDASILSLNALARRCADDMFSSQLSALEASSYGNNAGDVFTSKELEPVIMRLHKTRGKTASTGRDYSLPPLYKN